MTLRNEACMPELSDAWTTDLLSRQFSGVEHELLGLVQAYGLAHRLLIPLRTYLAGAPPGRAGRKRDSIANFRRAFQSCRVAGVAVTGRVPIARVVA